MNPSVELKNVMLRLYESMSSGDVSAIERLISRQSGVLVIGTDPDEWWAGYDTIVGAFKAQMQGMSGIRVEVGELSAFVEGTVGWGAGCPTFRLPNGQAITVRETTTFHLEDGEWKIVQLHHSLGVSNEETIGKG